MTSYVLTVLPAWYCTWYACSTAQVTRVSSTTGYQYGLYGIRLIPFNPYYQYLVPGTMCAYDTAPGKIPGLCLYLVTRCIPYSVLVQVLIQVHVQGKIIYASMGTYKSGTICTTILLLNFVLSTRTRRR